MSSRTGPFTLQDLLLTEAVKALEADTPLQDAAAMRDAIDASAQREARIVHRARRLAADTGLAADIAWLRRTLPALGLVVVAGGVLGAAVLAMSLLGDGHRINALAAMALLVLPNLAGIALWALVVASSGRGGSGALAAAAAWVWQRLPWQRRPARVLPGTLRLLDAMRLTPWLIGGLNHLLWALAYGLAALLLTAVLALSAYRLGWETTILSATTLQDLARAIGWLPAQLGLPAGVPEHPHGEVGSRALGWWLISGTLVYGALPRLLLLVLCIAVMWMRSRALPLDTQDPYYRKLISRFEALAPTQVIDEEHAAQGVPPAGASSRAEPGTLAVIGFELPPEVALPAELVQHASWSDRVDGSGDERRALLQRLAHTPPARLLLVCHAASTPDRGTGRFLDGAGGVPTALLLAPPEHAAAAAPRWRAWLTGAGRAGVSVLVDAAAAQRWSEGGHV